MKKKRNNAEKIAIYTNLFVSRTDFYGTYDFKTGKSFKVNKPVTEQVLLNHLLGKKPYGMYMLVKDKTTVVVVDFDDHDKNPPLDFINQAKNYNLKVHLEISKAKGSHAWIFFEKGGVSALKARTVVYNILNDIDISDVEVFPKQNSINEDESGNFINTPLNGYHYFNKKTVYVDPSNFEPYPDQWEYLANIELVSEKELDEIIEINDLTSEKQFRPENEYNPVNSIKRSSNNKFTALLPCAQKMLFGVKKYQRLTTFRLAVHLRNLGFPYDSCIQVLLAWAKLNRPSVGRETIKEAGIIAKVNDVYKKGYSSFGCGQPETLNYCSKNCTFYSKAMKHKN